MKKLLVVITIIALVLLTGSCIKGNPEDWPKESMNDMDIFGYAPQDPVVIMALHFDIMMFAWNLNVSIGYKNDSIDF